MRILKATLLGLFCSSIAFGQTSMYVYQNNGPMFHVPVSGIDSVTLSTLAPASMSIYLTVGSFNTILLANIDSITYTANLPTLTTGQVGSITSTSITVGGNITSDGGAPVIERGMVWGTSPNPTSSDNVVPDGSGTGAWNTYISGLTPNTSYYVRAYATNIAGTAYGNERSFTTQGTLAIDCINATLSDTIFAYSPFNGTLTVPYTGATGQSHNGETVNSTGITGLTATIPPGIFGNGSGTLNYQVSGTPNGSGAAWFEFNIAGPECETGVLIENGCQGGLCIGQQYQGGIIAYLLQPGDPGYDANIPHGIITTATPTFTGAAWGCDGVSIGGTQSGLGYGEANTAAILNGCAESGIAARICDDLVHNGYSDWYLPSIDELAHLYHNLEENGIGDFIDPSNPVAMDDYWSSTEVSSGITRVYNFWDGGMFMRDKGTVISVRAVRSF